MLWATGVANKPIGQDPKAEERKVKINKIKTK
jgi:hypothetical protein